MISEDNKYRVELSESKINEHSFLVALIPSLPIPIEFKTLPTITNCAVIAAHDSNGDGVYGYIHFEEDEKQFIGDCLSNACVPLNTWVWCNLYEN